MDVLSAWQNVIFLIPMGVGILLIVGSAFGLMDFDHDFDPGHDLDGADSAKDASALDVGRVPFSLILIIVTLVFGSVGFFSNIMLARVTAVAGLYFWISLAIAVFVTAVFSKRLIRFLSKHMPTTESYNVSKEQFRGCEGTLVTPTDATSGLGDIFDHERNIHRMACRAKEGKIPSGTQVVVLEYDSADNLCIVTGLEAGETHLTD